VGIRSFRWLEATCPHAAELTGISEAANVIYDDEKLDTSP
jgi:hypothetical protein